jgi:drug/metabolite transporter (DMT)-like permease
MRNRDTQSAPQSQGRQIGVLAALLLLDSMHFVFARLLLPEFPPALSVTYVLTVSTVEVGILSLLRGELDWRVLKTHLGLFVSIGLLIGISTRINYEVVALIDPGTASLLSKTSILFGLVFGVVWLGDEWSTQQVIGSALSLIGVFVISFQPGDYLRLGSLLVVGSSLMYALHAAIAKRYGDDIDLMSFFFFRLLATSTVLLALASVNLEWAWPSGRAWLLIILTATFDVVVSRLLYYRALRMLTMSYHTIVLTLSPIAASLWAWILFGTHPSVQEAIGGAAVIAGVAIVSLTRRRAEEVKTEAAQTV